MNEEHSKPFTPVLPSLLLPMTASSPCFLSNLQPRTHTHTETHTATHKCTHLNTKPVAHTKQVFILLDVSMLSMFLHLCVCVYRCVYVCVNPGISSLERVTNHKHSSLSLSIFFSSSLLLYYPPTPPPQPLWTMKDKHNLSSRSQRSPHKNVTSTYVTVNLHCGSSLWTAFFFLV